MAEKRVVLVIALVNLVYDKDKVKIDEKFKIRKSDLKELTERGFVEEINQEDDTDGEEDNNEVEGD